MFSRTSHACKIARSNQLMIVRALSSAEAVADSHRPVIQLYGLHARYANATYVAASKVGQLEVVEKDLNQLLIASKESPKFAIFLQNPVISRDDKTKFVSSLTQLSQITRNLLVTMAGNARLSELPKIVATYSQMMKAKRGEVQVKIITAQTLSKPELKEVTTAVQGQVPKGQKVTVEVVVDPSILGGLQIQIGDKFLDLSAKRRIDEFARMPLS